MADDQEQQRTFGGEDNSRRRDDRESLANRLGLAAAQTTNRMEEANLSEQIAAILRNPAASPAARLLQSNASTGANYAASGPSLGVLGTASTGISAFPQLPFAQRQRIVDDEVSALLRMRSQMGLAQNLSQRDSAAAAAAGSLPLQSRFQAGAFAPHPMDYINPPAPPPSDLLSRLRRELAASNSATRDTSISDALARSSMIYPPPYFGVLSDREPFLGAPPAGLGQLGRDLPLNALSPLDIEALLARGTSSGGRLGTLPNEAALSPYQQPPLRYHTSAPMSRLGLLNQQYPDTPSYTQPLDRVEAARFLASQGMGASLGLPFATTPVLQSLNIPPMPWPEGKEEESKDNRRLAAIMDSKEDDPNQLGASWDEIVAGDVFSVGDYRGLVSDLHLAVLAQVQPCALSHEDRVGLYKTRDIGFPGICCKHCGGVTGFGRFFPSSLTSLINGNVFASIVKHINEECRRCPVQVRDSIRKLEQQDKSSPFHYRRGSRRQFFTHVWNTIQEAKADCGDRVASFDQDDSARTPLSVSAASRESQAVRAGTEGSELDAIIPWDQILEGSEIVRSEDRYLVPDTIFAATAQTKPCQLTELDRVGRCKDHKLGSMGLCCKHCGGKEGSFGRYFPSNLQTFAQVEVSKQIVRHITQKCHACPPAIRNAILTLQESEHTQSSKRFPSRMVFFRRVWYRFHYGDNEPEGGVMVAGGDDATTTYEDSKPSARVTAGATAMAADDIPWERLVSGSTLVTMADRGFISDSQFAALAQMDQCTLTGEDRIGYNKDRAVGFVGLRCRFCNGRPGFGRYFPNTVRNFEKTSARETIVSHISLFCQSCPEDIRNALLSLQRIESSRDGSTTMRALVYGSGKLFFRRVWARLHSDQGTPEEDSKPAGANRGKETKRASPTEAVAVRSQDDAEDPSSDDTVESEANVNEDLVDNDNAVVPKRKLSRQSDVSDVKRKRN